MFNLGPYNDVVHRPDSPAIGIISLPIQLPELNLSQKHRQRHTPIQHEDAKQESREIQQLLCKTHSKHCCFTPCRFPEDSGGPIAI
jgi:hypothetical protein